MLNVYFPCGLPNYLAKPKSEIFISPLRLIKIFSGFRSYLWAIILPDGKCSFYAKNSIPAKFHSKSFFYPNRSLQLMELLITRSARDRNQVQHKHRDCLIDLGLLSMILRVWFHNILRYFYDLMSLKDWFNVKLRSPYLPYLSWIGDDTFLGQNTLFMTRSFLFQRKSHLICFFYVSLLSDTKRLFHKNLDLRAGFFNNSHLISVLKISPFWCLWTFWIDKYFFINFASIN